MHGTIEGIGQGSLGRTKISEEFKSKADLDKKLKKIEYEYGHYELRIYVESA